MMIMITVKAVILSRHYDGSDDNFDDEDEKDEEALTTLSLLHLYPL